MSPLLRIVIGLLSLLLAVGLALADRHAQHTRRDYASPASGLRTLAFQSALFGGLMVLQFGIWDSVACRRARLSWRANRYRVSNRLWRIAVPVWLLPALSALALARPLYWPLDQGGTVDPLPQAWADRLTTGWFALLACVVVYWSVAAWRHSARRGAPTCDSCGYNLTGATSDRCPECGHPIPAQNTHGEQDAPAR